EDVDVSSLKLTSDQSFHTWDDIEKFLNDYELEKDEHNHPIVSSPETKIPRYRKFSNEMIEFVEFCINHSVTSARSIGRLLKEKFSGRKIYQKSLYNSIQAAKKKSVGQ
ncbi:16087_t:CDS:2, partial [Gigaspora rosea]